MEPEEFIRAFTRELELRPARESDLHPLKDFLLSHGQEPWTLDTLWESDKAETLRRVRLHTERHASARVIFGPGTEKWEWLYHLTNHRETLEVHLLLYQVEDFAGLQ